MPPPSREKPTPQASLTRALQELGEMHQQNKERALQTLEQRNRLLTHVEALERILASLDDTAPEKPFFAIALTRVREVLQLAQARVDDAKKSVKSEEVQIAELATTFRTSRAAMSLTKK